MKIFSRAKIFFGSIFGQKILSFRKTHDFFFAAPKIFLGRFLSKNLDFFWQKILIFRKNHEIFCRVKKICWSLFGQKSRKSMIIFSRAKFFLGRFLGKKSRFSSMMLACSWRTEEEDEDEDEEEEEETTRSSKLSQNRVCCAPMYIHS